MSPHHRLLKLAQVDPAAESEAVRLLLADLTSAPRHLDSLATRDLARDWSGRRVSHMMPDGDPMSYASVYGTKGRVQANEVLQKGLEEITRKRNSRVTGLSATGGAIAGGMIGRMSTQDAVKRKRRMALGALLGAGVGAAGGMLRNRQLAPGAAAEITRSVGLGQDVNTALSDHMAKLNEGGK